MCGMLCGYAVLRVTESLEVYRRYLNNSKTHSRDYANLRCAVNGYLLGLQDQLVLRLDVEGFVVAVEEQDADALAGLHVAPEPPSILGLTRHSAEAPADLRVRVIEGKFGREWWWRGSHTHRIGG